LDEVFLARANKDSFWETKVSLSSAIANAQKP